eukprot:5455016-Amphidinium_carterae.1
MRGTSKSSTKRIVDSLNALQTRWKQQGQHFLEPTTVTFTAAPEPVGSNLLQPASYGSLRQVLLRLQHLVRILMWPKTISNELKVSTELNQFHQYTHIYDTLKLQMCNRLRRVRCHMWGFGSPDGKMSQNPG